MKLLKYIKFLESVLTTDELVRIKRGTDKSKGDVLVDKLSELNPVLIRNKDNSEVVITNASDILNKITTNGKFDKDKSKEYFSEKGRYQPKFLSGSEGFKLNDFKKTADFGGERGPGVNTRLYESIQMLYIAYSMKYPNTFHSGKLDNTQLTESIIKFLQKFINYDNNLKSLLSLYINRDDMLKITRELLITILSDPNWSATFLQVPKKLYKATMRANDVPRIRKVISTSKKYSLYHVSYKEDFSPIVTLMKKYSSLGVKTNFSKYCPGDLYLIETNKIEYINEEINSSIDMNDLTAKLNQFFDESIFIPVSLKKIGGRQIDSFDIIINGEKGRKLPIFDISNFIVTKDSDKGIRSKINTTATWTSASNNGESTTSKVIGFDSSNTSRDINIDGEVLGNFSRHGKISFKSIVDILSDAINDFNLPELSSFKELNDKTEEQLELMLDVLYNYMINTPSKIKVDADITGRNIDTKNKLISKIQSLQVISTFSRLEESLPNGPIIADEKITKIMRYALSIETDSFVTPRYLRII